MSSERLFYYLSILALLSVPLFVTAHAFLSLAKTDVAVLAIVAVTPTPTVAPDPNLLAEAGIAALEAGDFDEAIAVLTEAVALVPDSAELHNTLGIALTEVDRPNDAKQAFDAAVAHDPLLADALFNRARLQHRMKEWQAAEGDYLAAIAIEPQAIYLHELGNLYLDWERLVSAEAAYLQALQYDPNLIETYLNLSTLYGNSGEIEAAIANLQRVLLLDDAHVVAYANLAALYQFQGEHAQAKVAWQTVRILAPESELAQQAMQALSLLAEH